MLTLCMTYATGRVRVIIRMQPVRYVIVVQPITFTHQVCTCNTSYRAANAIVRHTVPTYTHPTTSNINNTQNRSLLVVREDGNRLERTLEEG